MTICVYCGSSNGNDPDILTAAREFGAEMATRNIGLVYGGSSLGVMGELANAVMQNGGRVTGVIPENLFSKEVGHTGITELITVNDMHERKYTMAELADAFVALPGGFGTMEELFEVITWNQIGLIRNPVTLLNLNEFYTPLLHMIHHASKTGFIKKENLGILQVATSVKECIELSLKQAEN